MPLRDAAARREYHRVYMAKRLASDPEFKAKHRARVRRNSAIAKTVIESIVAEFRAGGCALCDEREPVCMSAHHTDPTAKDFSIGQAVRIGVSAAKLRVELSKCVCICENCHRKVHAGLVSLPDRST